MWLAVPLTSFGGVSELRSATVVAGLRCAAKRPALGRISRARELN